MPARARVVVLDSPDASVSSLTICWMATRFFADAPPGDRVLLLGGRGDLDVHVVDGADRRHHAVQELAMWLASCTVSRLRAPLACITSTACFTSAPALI